MPRYMQVLQLQHRQCGRYYTTISQPDKILTGCGMGKIMIAAEHRLLCPSQCMHAVERLDGSGGYLYLICASHNIGASVLVLDDAELKSLPVCMHLGQGLLEAILLTGIDTDAL